MDVVKIGSGAKTAEEIKEEGKRLKPGWKTSEFIGKTILQIILAIEVVMKRIDPSTAGYIMASVEIVYNGLRTVLKINVDKSRSDTKISQ